MITAMDARPTLIQVSTLRTQPSANHTTPPAAPVAAAQTLSRHPPSTSETMLVITRDAGSDRFVQTLLDAESGLALRQYPDEVQLAFSRGVRAYQQAARHADS